MFKYFGILLFIIVSPSINATNLLEIYNQALRFNPTYLTSAANQAVAHDQIALVRAGLLPTLTATGSFQYFNHHGDNSQNFNNQNQNFGFGLTLNQTLIDFSKLRVLDSTKSTAIAAQLKTLAAQQDLITQVANAYFDVALAQITLKLDIQKSDDQKKLYQQAVKQYLAGQTTRTSKTDAEAAYATTAAIITQDQTNLTQKLSVLQQMSGNSAKKVAEAKAALPILRLDSLDKWLDKARQQNLEIKANQYFLQAARENISAKRAGHLPTLGVNVAFNSNKTMYQSATINNMNNVVSKDISAGATLSFPIFSGGSVVAQTREAEDSYIVTYQEGRGVLEKILNQTRQAYTTINNSVRLLKSLQTSIILQRQALADTIVSYHAGIQTMQDVLTAQDKLYAEQQKYYLQTYAYLNAILVLKQAAGVLQDHDISLINAWLN